MSKRFPVRIGDAIDARYDAQQERLQVERLVVQLKKRETELDNHIDTLMKRAGTVTGAGEIAGASVHELRILTVPDWTRLYSYVKKNDAFDLLERRLHRSAILDRLDDGKKVPVTVERKRKVRVHKLKR